MDRIHASVIFRPQYVWFLVHLYVGLIPNSSGQLAGGGGGVGGVGVCVCVCVWGGGGGGGGEVSWKPFINVWL